MVAQTRAATAPKPADPALAGARILVVEARYYDALADELLAGARAAIEAAGAHATVVTVPGALEIPAAVAILADDYDAVVALGCVIRGETGHYDIVAGESARALMDLSVQRRLPLGNGILTVETEAQALERARVAEMNKGGGAAEAALAVLALKRAAEAARPQ
ncbi:6,7-dimethyl-8-ribityllumazine synthase [Methylobacterium sp. GXS13]|jgi:6,7-dimethyl-8-ribityllumazine synthase|uniref:6,7-dimethyl-8-ribityllumazine synthase n=1 Tax=unclassified Methylobacterium TaxID=2615210 RepID=UPI00071B51C8|nr:MULTISPECIES: 6,7-dimethyl-8-ribityllumazine synthase [unclassified Methylobacterium]KST58570.1 6,7-dimethyl-8-ribityllumazine synthase [Methylobacterium sp. GXS13]MCJ2115580.1 6,7-dimethyl-8-ribityllumazine synthase [Methylobacterium sp. J-001]